MGSAFHQLCPRYNGTLTLIAPMAIRLWETFTFLRVLPFLNNPKDLDSSCKAGLDFWDCFGRKNLCLITEETRYGIVKWRMGDNPERGAGDGLVTIQFFACF